MNRRQRIRREMEEITRHNPTGDPHSLQMKRLESLNIETMLEVIDTLEKMDATNNALDMSNQKLTKSNLTLQKVAIFIAGLALLSSVAFGVIIAN